MRSSLHDKYGCTFPRALALASSLAVCFLPRVAQADQFVLFDATFDYSWEDANNSTPSKSHFYVKDDNFMNLDRPENWVSPVNYRDGSVHIRLEVLSRPDGGQQVGWALCYIANVGSYGCPYTDYTTETGVFEKDVAMDAFWTSGPITWESGIKQVDLVYTINNSGSGHVHFFPELAEETTPTSVRITMVQVSEGDTYDPSILEEPDGTGGSGSGGAGVGGSSETGGSDSGGATATGGAPGTDDGTGGQAASGGDAGSSPDDEGESADEGDAAAPCSVGSEPGRRGGTPWQVGLLGSLVVGGLALRLAQRRADGA